MAETKETSPMRNLTRSTSDRVIAGVCGGLGEYFNIVPIILRIVFILLALSGGIGVWVYLSLWLLVPESDRQTASTEETVKRTQRRSNQ